MNASLTTSPPVDVPFAAFVAVVGGLPWASIATVHLAGDKLYRSVGGRFLCALRKTALLVHWHRREGNGVFAVISRGSLRIAVQSTRSFSAPQVEIPPSIVSVKGS
jgi:hypothetical protein